MVVETIAAGLSSFGYCSATTAMAMAADVEASSNLSLCKGEEPFWFLSFCLYREIHLPVSIRRASFMILIFLFHLSKCVVHFAFLRDRTIFQTFLIYFIHAVSVNNKFSHSFPPDLIIQNCPLFIQYMHTFPIPTIV